MSGISSLINFGTFFLLQRFLVPLTLESHHPPHQVVDIVGHFRRPRLLALQDSYNFPDVAEQCGLNPSIHHFLHLVHAVKILFRNGRDKLP